MTGAPFGLRWRAMVAAHERQAARREERRAAAERLEIVFAGDDGMETAVARDLLR